MNTIYWITRFDSINAIMWTLFIITALVVIIAICCLVTGYVAADDHDDWAAVKEVGIKWIKIFSLPLLFSLICLVFIPTTKDAYLIYGVGGTIDYLKSNPTATKLPDKCINILNKWADKELNDSLDNQKDKETK